MSSASKSLPRSIPVVLYKGTEKEKVVHVAKVPLGKAAALGEVLGTIPAKIQQLRENERIRAFLENTDLDNMPLTDLALKLLEFLPELLAAAADTIIELLVVGTGLDREELENEVGLDEAAELLAAVLTVNNVESLGKYLKAAIQQLGIKPALPGPAARAATTSGSKR